MTQGIETRAVDLAGPATVRSPDFQEIGPRTTSVHMRASVTARTERQAAAADTNS
jgi:hypothetical protein